MEASLRDEFARSAELKLDQERDRSFVALAAEVQKRKRAELELDEKHDREEVEALADYVLATQAQVSAFTVKLDAYDTASVTALMENEEALEVVRERMKAMLEKAYVLPDGRRVFKTEDGSRVFDERGGEVRNVNPDTIENWRPKWELIASEQANEKVLIKERQELTDYQDKLDHARDRAADKGLTEKELKDLEKSLSADMPDRVRKHLADADAPATSPEQAPAIERPAVRPAARMDMPAL